MSSLAIDIDALAVANEWKRAFSLGDREVCRRLLEQYLPGVRTATARLVRRKGQLSTMEAAKGSFYVFSGDVLESTYGDRVAQQAIRVTVHLQSNRPFIECAGVCGFAADLQQEYEGDPDAIIREANDAVSTFLARVRLYAQVVDVVSRWLRARVAIEQVNRNT